MQYTSGEINENVYCNANESIQGALKRFNFERNELLGKINVLISSRDSADVPVHQPDEEKEKSSIEPVSRDSPDESIHQPNEEKEIPSIESISIDRPEQSIHQPNEEKEVSSVSHIESTHNTPQKIDVKPTEVNENSNGLTKVKNPRDIVVVRMEP